MSGSGQDSAQPTRWAASRPAARPAKQPAGQPTGRPAAQPAAPSDGVADRARDWLRRMTLALLARLGVPPSLARDALLIFAFTRIGFIGLTFGVMILKLHQAPSLNGFIALWARFDATFYARLARDGYSPAVPYRAAFFPLQPLLTAVVRPLIGGNIYLASIIVSNLAFLAALFGMAALTSPPLGRARSPWVAWSATLTEERTARGAGEGGLLAAPLATARAGGVGGDPANAENGAARLALAQRAMLYLALFPMALFLFAGYADSLFLALAIWCLVALRRKAWLTAGLLGLLATLTRQMGLFLALPFAYDYLSAMRWRPRAIRANALAIVLIPIGLLLFMAWLWHALGDPLAWLHAEKYWGHTFTPPWATIAHAVPALIHENYLPLFYKDALDLMMVVVFAALIVIGAVGARRRPLGDTAYSAAIWLLAVCYPAVGWPLQSDARYMLLAIPCFVTLAELGRHRWLHALILVTWLLLLLVTTQYFLRGYLII